MVRSCIVGALALALVLLHVTHALAQKPTAKPPSAAAAKKEARKLGDQGLAFYQDQRWAEAYDKFQDADRTFHAPTLVLFMARCKDKLGALLEAREHYRSLLREAVTPDAPPQFVAAKDGAFRELEGLEKRIPSLVVELSGTAASEAAVSIDGQAISGKALREPIDLDPGRHTVVVTAPGHEPVSDDMELSDSDTVRTLKLVIGGVKSKRLRLPSRAVVTPQRDRCGRRASPSESVAPRLWPAGSRAR